ncbi:MAG: DUF493 domain-containing protein [Cardiobacteriaceae bacterium]|nr:DUF493 domain-containing protein [Cardiobacteriaceae bacterium]
MPNESRESLLEFPCDFPIKITGKNTIEFQQEIMEIINKHIPEKARKDYSEQLSRNQNYLAITITANFNNQEELDSVYRAITAAKTVLMAL